MSQPKDQHDSGGIDRDSHNKGGGRPNNNRTRDTNNNSSQPNNSNSSVFYGSLIDRLRTLSFSSFQTLVLLWLAAKGYRDICVLKRTGARGRREIGGADLIARSPHDREVRVAVQIRYWQTPVQRRVVDELWGFMLRHGIPQGLIVTSSAFYPRAIRAVLEFPGRPIGLISAPQLAGSMAALGLGVRSEGEQLEVDESFFRTLDHLGLASNLGGQAAQAREARSGCRQLALGGLSLDSSSLPKEPQIIWWILLALLLFFCWWLILGAWR